MKYVDEFRDADAARALARHIAAEADPAREYRLMEFCGGHTHTLARYGIESMLPANVRMIHGPGCPVCVLPAGCIVAAAALAREPEVILCTYADMLRVPGAEGVTLSRARAGGADVRMVYSTRDALRIARARPDKEVVFFAIGFETTAPATAVAVKTAAREGLRNFSVYCNHVLTPAAMRGLLDEGARVDGFIGPGHVSLVIGSRAYEDVAARYHRPVVIAGFEPLDVMHAIHILIRQLNMGRAEVENAYGRAVTREGNLAAQAMMEEVFATRESFEWRGFGVLPHSALHLREDYATFDAERKFHVETPHCADHKACECGDVLRGVTEPRACKVFGTACTPDHPLGACMVSPEGACAAQYRYRRAEVAR